MAFLSKFILRPSKYSSSLIGRFTFLSPYKIGITWRSIFLKKDNNVWAGGLPNWIGLSGSE